MCVTQISSRSSPAYLPLPQSPRTAASLPYMFNVHSTAHSHILGGCTHREHGYASMEPSKSHFQTIVRVAPDWIMLVLICFMFQTREQELTKYKVTQTTKATDTSSQRLWPVYIWARGARHTHTAKKKNKVNHVDSTAYTYRNIIHVDTATVQQKVYLQSHDTNSALNDTTIVCTHVHKPCHVDIQCR